MVLDQQQELRLNPSVNIYSQIPFTVTYESIVQKNFRVHQFLILFGSSLAIMGKPIVRFDYKSCSTTPRSFQHESSNDPWHLNPLAVITSG